MEKVKIRHMRQILNPDILCIIAKVGEPYSKMLAFDLVKFLPDTWDNLTVVDNTYSYDEDGVFEVTLYTI